jgi:hypothetical protein
MPEPCPNCQGELHKQQAEEYESDTCDSEIRACVVERMDSFRRVAGRDGPASDIGTAALDREINGR